MNWFNKLFSKKKLLSSFQLVAVLITYVFFAPAQSNAFEIGQLNVFYDAKKGEPFYAEIRLNNISEDDFDNLEVEVLGKNEYEKFNMPYTEYEDGYSVEFMNAGKQAGFVVVTNPVSVPYSKINILVSARNSLTGEKKIRKFSMLNNKPLKEPQKPLESTVSPPVIPTTRITQRATEITMPKMDIVDGDTLENVAQTILLAYYNSRNVTLDQVMTALRRQNSDILAPKNSYKLQTGVSAFIPNYEEIISQSSEEARREIDEYYRPYFNKNKWKHAFARKGGQVRLKQSSQQNSNSSMPGLIENPYNKKMMAAQIDMQLKQRKNLVSQVSSFDKELKAMQAQLAIKNKSLQELQAQLKNYRSANGVWGIITGFIHDAMEMMQENPILWIGLVIGVILIILIFRSAFSSSDEIYYDPYNSSVDAFDEVPPPFASPPIMHQPYSAQHSSSTREL